MPAMPDGAPGASLLSVRDLNAWYGESHILHGAAFNVASGEVVTVARAARCWIADASGDWFNLAHTHSRRHPCFCSRAINVWRALATGLKAGHPDGTAVSSANGAIGSIESLASSAGARVTEHAPTLS